MEDIRKEIDSDKVVPADHPERKKFEAFKQAMTNKGVIHEKMSIKY